jgi:hypothetical protein
VTWNARTSLALEPTPLRTFADEPREDAEFSAGLEWTGDRFAARLQMTGAVDPGDGKGFRGDGSYVGMHLGNFMVSAGYRDRWWGPGWEGSLLLSTSARPIPSLTIERNHSDAFESPWLSWIGPWRAQLVFGQLESDRADFDETRFFAARVTFRPLQQLEIGLSRSAQWCGEGRPCDLRTFGDLLVGADNDQAPTEQPGNQLAGYDLRWAFKSIPLALYAQAIGEDEAGGLPSKFLGLGGLETWGSAFGGSWRAHVEHAATSCNFSSSEPAFDCAYESGIYTQGYRFRGRSIGHAMDSDGRMTSIGALFIESDGSRWEILLRTIELNRNAVVLEPSHTVAPAGAELRNVELVHARELGAGEARIGIGYDSYNERLDGEDEGVVRAYLQWQRAF